MIRISIGNMGSGKTASEVREMYFNLFNRVTYSNIQAKLPNCKILNPEYIIKKTLLKTKKTGEEIFKFNYNRKFWEENNEPKNIVFDELSNIYDAWRSMSKINQIMSQFQNSIRRVLESTDGGYGELVYITQQIESIDPRARRACTQIKHHVCSYQKTCKKCKTYWLENTDMPEQLLICPKCKNRDILRHFFI